MGTHARNGGFTLKSPISHILFVGIIFCPLGGWGVMALTINSFKYLLLRHAIQMQLGSLTIELTESPMEDLLSDPELTKLVTTFYSHLSLVGADPISELI